MLILTRRRGEKIIIGKNKEIVITFLQSQGSNMMRMGFEAPPDIPIIREELVERFGDSNRIYKKCESMGGNELFTNSVDNQGNKEPNIRYKKKKTQE